MNIVITGASKGLGRAIAEMFGADKQGHGLFLCSRNEETLKTFAKELQARYPRTNVQAFPCDLSDKTQLDSFAAWLKELAVPIDVLINNAGQFVPGNLHNEAEGVLDQML